MKPLKFLYSVTVPQSALAFFTYHLRGLRSRGHDVRLITHPEPRSVIQTIEAETGIQVYGLPMAREISPRDLLSLLGMLRLMQQIRPDVSNVSTPKAGLLGGLAAALTRVPLRVYVLHGLRSETAATGNLRRLQPLLRLMERITCACAHEVVCVSPSNRDEAIRLGLVPAHKIRVLGAGSPAGIAIERYAHPDPAAVARARQEWNIPAGTPVVGFVGRLVTQKGVDTLLESWRMVQAAYPAAKLLLIGEPEDANPLPETTRHLLEAARGVIRVPFEAQMERVYPLMTVMTLPSLHEGLGMVLLEAAAAGVPTVVTDAPGVRDTNLPGVTGLRVPVADTEALAAALLSLLRDPALAASYGRAGQHWTRQSFSQEVMAQHWEAFYQEAWNRRRQQRLKQYDQLKRAIDVLGAAAGLVVLSPVLGIVALLVAQKLGRPVLFRQTRPGLHGEPFTLLKFRSMTDAKDAQGQLLPAAERLPAFGKWLRSTSLDELPELVNVLRGEMSLVGPRPLLMAYLARYNTEQARRHEVRPGLTGLAQISGRNALSWPDKFQRDIEYVDQRSLALDLNILYRTVIKVLRRQDINFAEGGTEVPFMGNEA